MRVTFPVSEGVMLAMDCDLFLAALSRGKPKHCPEQHIRERAHGQRSMCECAVQVHRRCEDGRLRQRNDDQRDHPDVSQQGFPSHALASTPLLSKLIEARDPSRSLRALPELSTALVPRTSRL